MQLLNYFSQSNQITVITYMKELVIKRYTYIAGTTIKRLSILSRIPPWPGIRLPESFTLYVRFISDSKRSPNVANNDTINANPIQK